MPNGYCLKFNNATQQIFGNTVRPVVYVWQTNDREQQWSAQARLIYSNGFEDTLGSAPSSASKKKEAKNLAARAGFEWLRAQFPSIDLSG
ncbi:hypothetical protein MD484_g9043, partial [Candolleomyces efflorescens]